MLKPQEVFQAKQALDEKKRIANATMQGDRAESKPGQYMTSDDFKKPWARPW